MPLGVNTDGGEDITATSVNITSTTLQVSIISNNRIRLRIDVNTSAQGGSFSNEWVTFSGLYIAD